MRKLILYGMMLALIDPALLLLIYSRLGLWPVLGIVFLSPMIGARLVGWARLRLASAQTADPIAGLQNQVGGHLLLAAASFLFAYPGPVSTVLALLLLIPGVRRAVQARFAGAFLSSSASAIPGGGVIFSNMPGAPGQPADFGLPGGPGNLKPAQGRVVDTDSDQARLEA